MDDVISPTFNILLQYRCACLDGVVYEGPAEINHFDLYRLEDADELDDIDYFGITDEHSPGVSFVEWADKFEDALPDDYLRVSIKRTGVESRILLVESCGSRARALARLWLKALQAEQVEIEFNVEDSKGGSCRGGQ
jgi:tRNA threonylcarbamoyladenosine biosynthesis protein TsaE